VDTHLIIVIVLVALAIVDLMVGVANDAVNFLNSAIGSKVANFKLILIVASIGILLGVFMSGGMMEVARKGIFNPEFFFMPELLVIFVAVMFGDVILLDTYNTFGLPTSTTVSIVFGLFGSALAVSIIKVLNSGQDMIVVFDYIKSGTVLAIIGGIVSSIFIAFFVSSIVQYLTRLIFSFDYEKRFKKYGPIWAGFALSFLSYFIIIKGLKGSTIIPEEINQFVKGNFLGFFGILFSFWAILIFILSLFKKFNPLKFIVLFGTFALALAFAANDLVNFIGAPLAGLHAYQLAQGMENPLTTGMVVMTQKIKAENWILLVSGIIMVLTLFYNKKAYSVSKTTISLTRQSDGYERFESNAIARSLVKMFINIVYIFKNITPEPIQNYVKERFDQTKYVPFVDEKGEKASFDLIRAAVILVVAAALISVGTLLKLPLSTTYVTFIVAMAAALPDNAWGRESAVFRVSGVITVIGGWFFTAISAMLVSGIIATIIYFGGIYAVLGFSIAVMYLLYRSSSFHKNKEDQHNQREFSNKIGKANNNNIMDEVINNAYLISNDVKNIIELSIDSFIKEDSSKSKMAFKKSKNIEFEFRKLNADLLMILEFDKKNEFEYASMFAITLSGFRDIGVSTKNITEQIHQYINNNHSPLTEEQSEDLLLASSGLSEMLDSFTKLLKDKDFEKLDEFRDEETEFLKKLKKLNKNQVKRIKEKKSKTRRSILYFNIITEMRNIAYISEELIESIHGLYVTNDFNNIEEE